MALPVSVVAQETHYAGGLGYYGPYQWDFSGVGCDPAAIEIAFLHYAEAYGIPTDQIQVIHQSTLSNDPMSLFDWEVNGKIYVSTNSHGNTNRYAGEAFDDSGPRDARITQYENMQGMQSSYFVAGFASGEPCLSLSGEGVAAIFGAVLQDTVIVDVYACKSASLVDDFGPGGKFLNPSGPATYYGYQENSTSDVACEHAMGMVASLCCVDWPTTDGSTGQAFAANNTGAGLRTQFGSSGLFLNTNQTDCGKWPISRTAILSVRHLNGVLSIMTQGENKFANFEVRGYTSWDENAKPHRITWTEGVGSDAGRTIRWYELPVEDHLDGQSFVRGEVVEFHLGIKGTVKEFAFNTVPPEWKDEPADGSMEFTPISREAPPRGEIRKLAAYEHLMHPEVLFEEPLLSDFASEVWEPGIELGTPLGTQVGGGGGFRSEGDEADVILVTHDAFPTWALPALWQAGETPKQGEQNYRAVAYTCAGNPEDVQEIYLNVWNANVLANQQYQEVPFGWGDESKPLMHVVGGDSLFWYIETPDELDKCSYGWCKSWLNFTDVSPTDGRPDGYVSMLQVNNAEHGYDQVQTVAYATWEWNRDEYVNPQQRVAYFCSDRTHGQTVPWIEDEVRETQLLLASAGYPTLGFERESDYLGDGYIQLRQAAGTALMNQQPTYVLSTGAYTWDNRWTMFIYYNQVDWVGRYRYVVLGPSCLVGADWHWNAELSAMKECQLHRTMDEPIAVYADGRLDTAYGLPLYRHQQLQTEEFSQATPGTPFTVITGDVADRLYGEGYDMYARSNIGSGLLALSKSGSSVSVDEDQRVSSSTMLRYRVGTSHIEFEVSMPEPGDVDLRLFDQSGRLVAVVVTGYQAAGTASYALEPPSTMSTGIYFAKLTTGREERSKNVIYLRR